ncbi:Uncharacterised protein [Mycobacterium tuberculosis]|uniref:Uncharacterized protein n=1 Tax=Mycobacterium tuberculosis TaxID=1773 RepID=A0A916LAH9_MYCTX|nr:Uncharacterised protein [Mycobacterium tuberculosis]COX90937.1 Uncharacterised protein [Mycobacterium tuberculosis]COY17473.1 Uncharacterised protein [Mycobacterium tuberculosis]
MVASARLLTSAASTDLLSLTNFRTVPRTSSIRSTVSAKSWSDLVNQSVNSARFSLSATNC